MTTQEFIEKQRKAFANIIAKDEPLRLAALTAHKDMTKRIFVDGKNANDGNIGQYDTKRPLYVNPKKSPGAATGNKIKGIEGLNPPTGKTGKTHFADGTPHKTTYLNNYKEYRSRIGRKVDKVNLVLSGDLQSDFANGNIKNPVTHKVNQHEYVVTLSRQTNQDKREGLEKKYGEIFSHTTSEVQKFVKIAEQELKNELNKAGL